MTAPLQFTQVREDPLVDRHVIESTPGRDKHVLLVASAGCTALSLLADPLIAHIDAVDFNPTQLALCRLKAAAIAALDAPALHAFLGVVPGDPLAHWSHVAAELAPEDRGFWDDRKVLLASGILQAGNYERLFSVWRHYLHAFVCPPERLAELFQAEDTAGQRSVFAAFADGFWPVGFTLAFHADLLHAIFGPKATQHAAGPYDRYFQAVFQRAIMGMPAAENYFLSQLLLGTYLPGPRGLPPYLQPQQLETIRQRLDRVTWHQGTFPQVLARREGPEYAMVQLSNIMDWSDTNERDELAAAVMPHLASGGRLLVRQLNNETPLPAGMTAVLHVDPADERRLWESERSFFYNRVLAGIKA